MGSPERGPRRLMRLAMMYSIRYTPLPWRAKEWAINRLTAGVVVVAVAIIPDDDGRVLMVRARYSGRWIFPGGAVHPGEQPCDGLVRECREELGQRVAGETLSGMYALPGTRLLFIVYRCAPLAGPPRLSVEHDAWRYTAVPALPRPFRQMAEQALAPGVGDGPNG